MQVRRTSIALALTGLLGLLVGGPAQGSVPDATPAPVAPAAAPVVVADPVAPRAGAAAVVPGLKVTVAGLPATVKALVTVTGPKQSKKAKKGYSAAVTRTVVLPKLVAGKYTVVAKPIKVGQGVWTPVPVTKVYVVKAKLQTQALVTYRFSSTGYWTSKVSATPLTATVVPDTARAVTALVPRTGGTITATSADGVTFTLTVPDKALIWDTSITVTPLAAPVGVPSLGSTSYGVQLSPDGQRFYRDASLTITPAAGMSWPVNRQLPLSIEGARHTVGLATVQPTAATVIKLGHFSSYAVMIAQKGFSADLAPVRAFLGGTAEQRIESAFAEKMMHNRVKNLVGVDPDSPAGYDIVTYVRDMYEQVVKLRMAAAKNSCAAGRLAAQDLLLLDRKAQLLGTSLKAIIGVDGLSQLVGAFGDTASDRCMFEEYQVCAQQHIVTRIIPQLIMIMREDELLGLTDMQALSSKRASQGLRYAQACLNFEIDLAGTATLTSVNAADPAHVTTESVLGRAVVGLTDTTEGMDPTALPVYWFLSRGLFIANPSTIDSTGYSTAWGGSKVNECWNPITTSLAPRNAAVQGSFGFEPKEPTGSDPTAANKVKDFTFSFALAPSSDGTFSHYLADEFTYPSTSSACTQLVATHTIQESYVDDWLGPYASANLADPNMGLALTNWTIVNDGSGVGDILAIKDVGGTITNPTTLAATGNLHAVLIHKPKPAPARLP